MSTAESCCAKFYKGKILIISIKKYSVDLKASCRLETMIQDDKKKRNL